MHDYQEKTIVENKPLYPHQLECVTRGREKSLAMFLEMGLGKTRSVYECIPLTRCLNVVMCPISAHLTWLNEAEQWRPDINIYSTVGLSARKRRAKREVALNGLRYGPTILLINYEQAVEIVEWLKKNKLHLYAVIADESAYIKNFKAKRTKAAHEMRRRAKIGYALTGTPILHGPMDLYSQIRFVDENILPESWWAFRNRYAVMGGFEGKQIVGYKRTDHLLDRIKPYVVSIKKEDVAIDLPPKIYQQRFVSLNQNEHRHYELIKKEALMDVGTNEYMPITNALAKITKMAQASCGFSYYEKIIGKKQVHEVGNTKRKTVVELLTTGDLSGRQCVIWTVFDYELIQLTVELQKMGVAVSSKHTEGQHITAANVFLNGKSDVLIANPQSLGTGINLQRATAMIFVSNNYRYGDRVQAEARAHRIGQTRSVTIVDIIAAKTIDEKILNSIHKKGEIANMIKDVLGVNIKKHDLDEWEDDDVLL